jgi:hypothetical protein
VWIAISPGSLPKKGIFPAKIKNNPNRIMKMPKNTRSLPMLSRENI